MAKAEAPRWRVNETSFIGHSLVQPGDEVFYTPTTDEKTGVTDGVGENLSPLNDEAQAIVDGQKVDHPDKTANDGQRRRKEAEREAEIEESRADKARPVKPMGDKRSKARRGAPAQADDDEIA